MDGWTDGRMVGWLDGRMDGWSDGWMGGWMSGWVEQMPMNEAQSMAILFNVTIESRVVMN